MMMMIISINIIIIIIMIIMIRHAVRRRSRPRAQAGEGPAAVRPARDPLSSYPYRPIVVCVLLFVFSASSVYDHCCYPEGGYLLFVDVLWFQTRHTLKEGMKQGATQSVNDGIIIAVDTLKEGMKQDINTKRERRYATPLVVIVIVTIVIIIIVIVLVHLTPVIIVINIIHSYYCYYRY